MVTLLTGLHSSCIIAVQLQSLVHFLIIARGQWLLPGTPNCCCFCRLLPRPVSQMVWKFVGTTYVALIILVALHLFHPPPLSSLPSFVDCDAFRDKFWAQDCSSFHACGGKCLFHFIKSCVLTTDSSLTNLETEGEGHGYNRVVGLCVSWLTV